MFHRALKTILVVSCIMCFTRSIEGKTYWSKSVDTSQYRIPAGQERGTILHACRLKVNEDLIVGKVWTHKGSPICNSAYRGEYFGSLEFEVLNSSPDTTSWIPYTGAVGINNIIGGQLNRSIIYVCRAFAENWLIPGYLVPQTNTCHVEIRPEGKHPYHEVKDDFEVLVINKYSLVTPNSACLSY